jgi:hypothetical protein
MYFTPKSIGIMWKLVTVSLHSSCSSDTMGASEGHIHTTWSSKQCDRCVCRLIVMYILNPLKAELSPICHLLALLGAHHILHVSRIRVNVQWLYDVNATIHCYISFATFMSISFHLVSDFSTCCSMLHAHTHTHTHTHVCNPQDTDSKLFLT